MYCYFAGSANGQSGMYNAIRCVHSFLNASVVIRVCKKVVLLTFAFITCSRKQQFRVTPRAVYPYINMRLERSCVYMDPKINCKLFFQKRLEKLYS